MSIKDLQLAAKTTVDGFMAGINKSTIKGQGLEFSQYRSYQPEMTCASLIGKCMRGLTVTISANQKWKQVFLFAL